MRITEGELRKVIRQVIRESVDIDMSFDLKGFYDTAKEGKPPCEGGHPLRQGASDGEINAFVYMYCFSRDIKDPNQIEPLIVKLKNYLRVDR